MSSAWAVLIASGKGEKFSADTDTAFLTLVTRPVITFSLAAFEQCPEVEGVVVVAPKERVEHVRVMAQMYGFSKVKKIVTGTNQRQTSVLAGLKVLDQGVDLVVIHDASRPSIQQAQVAEVIKSAKRGGSGVLGLRVSDAPKRVVKGGKVKESLPREEIWLASYPQAYQLKLLTKGYAQVQKRKLTVDDDSEALSLIGADVLIVPTERTIVRISSPTDLMLAESLLRS